jgi:hypothetical protein
MGDFQLIHSWQMHWRLHVSYMEDQKMRLVLFVALVVGTIPARAQPWVQNKHCEIACKSTLDECAAASNKIMQTALRETEPFKIGTTEREKADIKFENAFLAGEQCWDRYYRCAGNCRPAKGCIDACQSAFKQCFADGEKTMREGLREMKKFKFGSPDWKTAYAKGDKGTGRCLTDNLNCQGHCANP